MHYVHRHSRWSHPVLNSLITYLASLPPGQTTWLMALGAMTPGLLMMLGGFTWVHAADVQKGR